MHICFYHDAVIPPKKYGGTERIIYWLAQALNQSGHKTSLIARAGSSIPGTNTIIIRDQQDWKQLIPSDVDVLHLWSTPNTQIELPFVVTIEGNGQPGEQFHPNTLFISKKHAENHGAKQFVYNGIDPDHYFISKKTNDSLVFLAKASWNVKNLKGAIRLARATNLKLDVLGSRDWPLALHKTLPRIRGVKYHGMVDDHYKRQVLSQARALLFPVLWHEPFGIAITEALASGCAVIGTPYGSLPEIITPETGYLSSNGSQLAQALLNLDQYDPKKCRERVFNGFTHLDMARNYLKHYESVLKTGRIIESFKKPPETQPQLTQNLLKWTSPPKKWYTPHA